MTKPALRVLILGINYSPESSGIAPYTTGLATGLAERGHAIEVFTGFPHYPDWKRSASRARFRSREVINGVLVRRFNHPVSQRFQWLGRVLMELSFGLQISSARWGRHDVVICVTPPLFSAAMSVIRARVTPRRPAIGVVVQDIYTRGISETGATSGIAARAIRFIESATLTMADGVSTIHAGFSSDLFKTLGVPPSRMREIRNWTHIDTAEPSASRAFRASHGWGEDEIIVLHAGNMGFKQGLENVIASAALADQTGTPVKFVLLGDGNQRAELQRHAAGIQSLQFLQSVSESEFPAALGAADLLLVNERQGVAHMSVPSKLTSYFKAAKPVLAAVDSEGYAAYEIAAAGAGVCVPPDRPDLLLQAAVRVGSNRKLSLQLGEAGLQYSEEQLSYSTSIDAYEQWMHSLANSNKRK